MPTIDPVDSALDALVTHFTSALAATTPIVTVRKGWPEPNVSLNLTGPVLTIFAGPDTRDAIPPQQVDEVTDDGVTTYTWKYGLLHLAVQLDLWSPYRAKLAEAAIVVEAAANNQIPHTTGLWLTQPSYFSRPLTCLLGEGSHDMDGDSAATGEFRKTWMMQVETDLVVEAEGIQQLLIQGVFTTQNPSGGSVVTDATVQLAP